MASTAEDAPVAGPKPWRGVLFPVFVTTHIPLEVLNACLKGSTEYLIGWDLEESIAPALITDSEGPKPSQPSYPPIRDFSPPLEYLGQSAEQLRPIYLERWAHDDSLGRADKMSGSSFIMLDEQTAKDQKTCLLVSCEGDGRVLTARCEFDLMCKIIDGPEQGEEELGEGYEENVEEIDGQSLVVFRRSWFDRMFDSSGFGTIDFDENGFREGHPNFRRGN